MLPGEPADRKRRSECCQCGGQAQRPFGGKMQQKANGARPVIENWLLEPGLAVETRRNPIARRGHRAGDPTIAGLVWPHQSDGAEMAEQRDENDRGAHRRIEIAWTLLWLRGTVQGTSSLSFRFEHSRAPLARHFRDI